MQIATALQPTEPLQARQRRLWLWLICAVVFLGATFRIAQYLSQQSFWRDEVSLLLNIVHKNFSDFFHGNLDYSQAAPPLFLSLQRLLALHLGTSEYAQRLLPLICSLLSLPLFALLAWRILSPSAATVALALLSFSDRFIARGAEVKQYSGDVMLAILLTLLALRAIQDNPAPGKFAILALLASIAIWFSHTTVLVFAALSVVFLVLAWQRGSRHLLPFLAANLPFLFSFFLLYFLSIRPQSQDAFLQTWWQKGFLPWSSPLQIPIWLLANLWNLATFPLIPFEALAIFLVPLILLGLLAWCTARNFALLALTLSPLGMALLASALHKYPFSADRLNMFLVPSILLLAGAGVQFLAHTLKPQLKKFSWIICIPMLLVLLGRDASCLLHPRTRSHLRPIIQYVKNHRSPGETIYAGVHHREVLWYWPQAEQSGPVNDQSPPDNVPEPRFWYLVGDRPGSELDHKVQQKLAAILKVAQLLEPPVQVPGGVAFHFQKKQ